MALTCDDCCPTRHTRDHWGDGLTLPSRVRADEPSDEIEKVLAFLHKESHIFLERRTGELDLLGFMSFLSIY